MAVTAVMEAGTVVVDTEVTEATEVPPTIHPVVTAMVHPERITRRAHILVMVVLWVMEDMEEQVTETMDPDTAPVMEQVKKY